MDFLQDYLPQAAQFYHDYYHPYKIYLYPIYRVLLLSQSYFYHYLFPTLYPLYALSNRALKSISTDAPDITTLAILAVALIISIRVLDFLRRTIISWISVALRIAMWVSIAGVGLYVWQRGIEQSLEDFGFVWGLLAGLGGEGERIGGARARGRQRDAKRMAGAGKRGRTRGAGW